MTTSRASQVDLATTPFYHCMARCVRQAFLCGFDAVSGRNYDHRKAWVLQRLKAVAEAFAIDVCAYAVMSNHLHLVLHVDQQRAATWSDQEVARRVTLLFPNALAGTPDANKKREQPQLAAAQKIFLWRERLCDLSWFMRCLNEFIARRANLEDGCKGRFWEGRFKSQALLDEGAVLACMSYVDLNPVRAGLARGLADSDWTSIQQRLTEAATALSTQSDPSKKHEPAKAPKKKGQIPLQGPSTIRQAAAQKASICPNVPLMPLVPCLAPKRRTPTDTTPSAAINIALADYIELLEWTGRQIDPKKRGYIKDTPSPAQPPTQLFTQSQIAAETWLDTLKNFHAFACLVGSPQAIRVAAPKFQRQWVKGIFRARAMYRKQPPEPSSSHQRQAILPSSRRHIA